MGVGGCLSVCACMRACVCVCVCVRVLCMCMCVVCSCGKGIFMGAIQPLMLKLYNYTKSCDVLRHTNVTQHMYTMRCMRHRHLLSICTHGTT